MQVALALVLFVGSGLMIRTFQQLRRVQPGFTHPEEIQIVHSTIPEAIAKEPERVMRMQHEILDKLAAIPGVTSVGLADAAPLESSLGGTAIRSYAEDKTFAEGQVPPLRQIRKIAPGFFKTMGTRVVAGRDFTWTDLYEKRRVAIVSENLAREWWGDPACRAGQADSRSGAADPWREIVGVVEDVYDNGVHVKPPEFAYWPALMDRYIWGGENGFVRRLRHVRDPLQPDGNGGPADGGAASHLVRERQAAGVPRHHARRRSTTSPWHGRRSRS